jgi:hypothetical protein
MGNTDHARLRLASFGFKVLDGGISEPRKYGKSTSGRSVSHRTLPRDSRSIEMASDSPAGLYPRATLSRCPTEVSQASANGLRSSIGRPNQNSLNSMNVSHHTVLKHATPFGGFTKRCHSGENSGMEIKELAEVRRVNTRRLVNLRYEGNKSALARAYQEVSKQEQPTPNLFGDLLREKSKKAFGEKLARGIEKAAGLKAGQLDIRDSPLEIDEARVDRTDLELQSVIDDMTKREKQELIRDILERRKKHRRAS